MRTLFILAFLFISFSATAQIAVKEGPNDVYFFSPESVEISGQHFKVQNVKKGLFNITYKTDPLTFVLPRRGKGFKITANHTGETYRVLPDEIKVIKAY
jgi:hypothetical protein